MHLFGFIIRIYHYARPPERQISCPCSPICVHRATYSGFSLKNSHVYWSQIFERLGLKKQAILDCCQFADNFGL